MNSVSYLQENSKDSKTSYESNFLFTHLVLHSGVQWFFFAYHFPINFVALNKHFFSKKYDFEKPCYFAVFTLNCVFFYILQICCYTLSRFFFSYLFMIHQELKPRPWIRIRIPWNMFPCYWYLEAIGLTNNFRNVFKANKIA